MALPWKLRLFLRLANLIQVPIHKLTPESARRDTDKGIALAKMFYDKPTRVKRIEDNMATGSHGDIPLKIYYPLNPVDGRIVLYFHGGGFVISNIRNYDFVCSRLSHMLGAIVIAVEYKLAPEYKFPIPVEDCYDAACWAYHQAAKLGGNPEKIILMGDSAGGNLAAVVSVMARDNGSFTPAAQVLIYPSTDSSVTYPSEKKYAEGYILSQKMMDWFIYHYMRTEDDRTDPRLSPLLTPDLGGLPPAFILTAEYDPLKDEGKAYADALKKARTPVEYRDYVGLVHGFISFPLVAENALAAFSDIRDFIQKNV